MACFFFFLPAGVEGSMLPMGCFSVIMLISNGKRRWIANIYRILLQISFLVSRCYYLHFLAPYLRCSNHFCPYPQYRSSPLQLFDLPHCLHFSRYPQPYRLHLVHIWGTKQGRICHPNVVLYLKTVYYCYWCRPVNTKLTTEIGRG